MAQNLVVQLLLKTGAFSSDLKVAKGQIQEFQATCKEAGGLLDNFSKGLGINIGSLSKFGLAAAAAGAAGKVLKDAFQSNTDMMDLFNASMEKVKSTYKSITSQMFGNSSMNLDFRGVAEQAQEYYNAIDYSQVAMSAITTELKLQEVQYNRLLATAMDVSLSEVDRLEALNAASDSMARQLQLKRQLAQIDKVVAKETLESGVINRGVDKTWLEGPEGQKILREFAQIVQDENGQWMYEFDRYFASIDTRNANTGFFGHRSKYENTIEQMKTPAGAEAVEKEAKRQGYADVNAYLKHLREEANQATSTINSMKYKLAEALHNYRSENGGLEAISKYIMLYLEDMGIEQIAAEEASAKATIERLRKEITGKDGKTVIYKEGSIGKIEDEISKLKQKIKEATTQDVRDTLIAQVEALQATLDVMNGKNTNLTTGSVKWLQNEMNKVQTELNSLELGLPDTAGILQKMNDWEGTWDEFVANLTSEEKELFDKFADVMNKRWNMMNTISSYQSALDYAGGKKTPKQTKKPEVVYADGSYGKQRQELETQIKDKRNYLMQGVNLTEDDIRKSLEELKVLQEELDKLDIHFGFKTMDTGKGKWDDFNTTLMGTSTIVGNLSNAFAACGENATASILNMVASAIPAIGQLISSFSALSAAEAVEAGVAATGKAVSTSKHWVEAIAAVASLGAVVATAIASAKNMGNFANGGIIGGTSYTGDKLTANVNSGEMILNRSQQSKLFRQINNMGKFANGGIVGGNSFTGDRLTANVNSGEMILNRTQQTKLFKQINNNTTTVGGEVTFHISGTDLVGVLNNNNRKSKLTR